MPLRLWAALGGIIAVLVLLTWSHTSAYQAGRQAEREAVLARSIEILRERNATDDEIGNMDDRELCHVLGGYWLQDERTCL